MLALWNIAMRMPLLGNGNMDADCCLKAFETNVKNLGSQQAGNIMWEKQNKKMKTLPIFFSNVTKFRRKLYTIL